MVEIATQPDAPPTETRERRREPATTPRPEDPIQAAIGQLPESVRPIAEAEYNLLRTQPQGGTGVATARRDLALATGEREAREQAATQQRELLQQYRANRIETPDFVPTQENAMSLGTLFGLVGVVGTMMGGRGQQSAMQAMNAMSGMLAGWRQGRTDLYNRERQQFDVALRRVQEQNNVIQRDFQEALNLMRTDLDAGIARAREAAARHGVSIAGAAATQQGAQGVISFLQGLRTTMMQLEQGRQRLSGGAPIARMDRAADGSVRYYAAHRDTGNFLLDSNGQRVEMAPPRTAGRAVGEIQNRYNIAVAEAVVAAANDIVGIGGLPALVEPPVLREYLTDPQKTVTRQLTAYAGQRLTPTEQRAAQQILAGITRAVTTISAAGRPGGVTASALSDFGRVAPQPGDSRLNWYLFLALIKQDLSLGVTQLELADATPTQLRIAREARDRVNQAIPFSVADINKILTGPRGQTLLSPQTIQILQTSGARTDAERQFRALGRERLERGDQPGAPQPGTPQIPPAAIEILRADPSPEGRREFDEIFGAGAAERILGGR